MSYGKTLKRIRTERGMSLRGLERLTGIGSSGLSKIENERSTKGKERLKVPIDTLQHICASLNYPFRQFLEEAEYIPPLSPLQRLCECLTDEQQEKAASYLEKLLADK